MLDYITNLQQKLI